MTHATTPWGFNPLTGVTNFKHEYLSNREELHGDHISTETSRQEETTKSIIDPEYINLVVHNSHVRSG